jgi:hypothetical protein
MATLDLSLPSSQSLQIQIERKNAAPLVSRPRKRTNPLLPKGYKADDMLPTSVSGLLPTQLKVEHPEEFPSVKPHSVNASDCPVYPGALQWRFSTNASLNNLSVVGDEGEE